MITRAEAEQIAARWARSESDQRGYDCEPVLDEFDLGFVISTRPPAAILPVPGDGARTVIDRATGVVSTWPGIPLDDLAVHYRRRRPDPGRTGEAAAAIRRAARRSPSPTSAAHLTVDGRLFRAQGAKGDQRINHHPLVARHLSTVDESVRVRGAERHAELIALSEALYSAAATITLDDARAWLVDAEFAVYLVRETGDPSAGRPTRPCQTCIGALVDFALLPWSDLALTTEWRHGSDRIPQPGRFPHEVARTLAGGGWTSPNPAIGDELIDRAVRASGGRLRPFELARRVAAEFAGVRCGRRGAGLRRAVRLLTIDPELGAHAVSALDELAQVVGAPLFPIGLEGGDAIVAVDDRGRVFVLDQAGEWFVGQSIDEALVSLLAGDGPAARLHDDGTW